MPNYAIVASPRGYYCNVGSEGGDGVKLIGAQLFLGEYEAETPQAALVGLISHWSLDHWFTDISTSYLVAYEVSNTHEIDGADALLEFMCTTDTRKFI